MISVSRAAGRGALGATRMRDFLPRMMRSPGEDEGMRQE